MHIGMKSHELVPTDRHMQRYLVITDSYKLQYLMDNGELRIAPFELCPIASPLPTAQCYLDLLLENSDFAALHEKIFLIAGTMDDTPRESKNGLWLGINEIEFLVAVDRTAAGSLRKKYPTLHFESLPRTIKSSYHAWRLQECARAGAGAISVLLGQIEPPPVLSLKHLKKLIAPLPRDVTSGLMIRASRKASCHECPLSIRTFMTLLIAYRRTLNYPEGNAGYVLDMLEIYHYAVNRYDNQPIVPENIEHTREMYNYLTHLDPELASLSLPDLLDHLRPLKIFERFFCALDSFSGGQGLVPFCLLRALDGFGLLRAGSALGNGRISYQHLISVANDIDSLEERQRFAMLLGAVTGYQRVSYTLYSRLTMHILQDFQDTRTDIEKETSDDNSPLMKPAANAMSETGTAPNDITAININDNKYERDESLDSCWNINKSQKEGLKNSGSQKGTDRQNAALPDAAEENSNLDNEISENIASVNLEDEDRFAELTGVPDAYKTQTGTQSTLDMQGTQSTQGAQKLPADETTPDSPASDKDEKSPQGSHASEILQRVLTSIKNKNREQDNNELERQTLSPSSNDATVNPEAENKASSGPLGNILSAYSGYEIIDTSPLAAITHEDNNRFGISPFYSDGLIRFLDEVEEEQEIDDSTKNQEQTCTNNVFDINGFLPVQTPPPAVHPYRFACTDGFSEAVSMLKDLSTMPNAEINAALEAVVLTESPVSEEFVIERFKLICRRAGLPFRRDIEERRFRAELINVCEVHGCTIDEEGFIYLPDCPVTVRHRTPDGLSRTMRRAMGHAETVSPKEIMAAYQHLLKNGIGISKPEPEDIIELIGLCQRRYCRAEDIERIKKVLGKHLGPI